MDQISWGWGLFFPFEWLPNYHCSNKTCPVVLSMSPFSVWGFRLPLEEPLVPVKQSVQSLIHSYSIIRLSVSVFIEYFGSALSVLYSSLSAWIQIWKKKKVASYLKFKGGGQSRLQCCLYCLKKFILAKPCSSYSPCDGSSGCHICLSSFHVTL